MRITGDLGAGKTSFLDAVLVAKEDVGAYGARRALASFMRLGARTVRIEARWQLTAEERERAQIPDAGITTVSAFGEGAPALSAHPEGLRALFAVGSGRPHPAGDHFPHRHVRAACE